jgi:hypothetical protein
VNENTLFIFGGGVSMLVFGGVFTYAMYSFREWSERSGNADPRPQKK